jgi:hypothetical protein
MDLFSGREIREFPNFREFPAKFPGEFPKIPKISRKISPGISRGIPEISRKCPNISRKFSENFPKIFTGNFPKISRKFSENFPKILSAHKYTIFVNSIFILPILLAHPTLILRACDTLVLFRESLS